MELNNERNRYFDFFKGIACICVVFIHFQFPGNIGIIIGALSKFAVPFFFMIAGYYALRNGKYDLKRKVLHILRLIIISEMVIFLYEITKGMISGESLSYIRECFSFIHFFQMLLFNKPITYGYLWFLYALIYCYITLYIIRKFQLTKTIPIIIIAGLVCFFCLGEGITLTGKSYFFSLHIRNQQMEFAAFNLYIFRALPYFLLGYFYGNIRNIYNIPRYTLYIIFFMGSLLSIVERIYIGWFQFYAGTLFMILAIFTFASQNKESALKNKNFFLLIEHIGNCDSDMVYIVHVLLGSIITSFIKITGIIETSSNLFLWSLPIIVLSGSLLLAEMRNRYIKGISHGK